MDEEGAHSGNRLMKCAAKRSRIVTAGLIGVAFSTELPECDRRMRFENGKIRYKKSCQRYTKSDQDGVYDLPQNILVVGVVKSQRHTPSKM